MNEEGSHTKCFNSECFGCVDNAHERTYCYDIELKLERQRDCVQRFGYETTLEIIGGVDAGHGARVRRRRRRLRLPQPRRRPF